MKAKLFSLLSFLTVAAFLGATSAADEKPVTEQTEYDKLVAEYSKTPKEIKWQVIKAIITEQEGRNGYVLLPLKLKVSAPDRKEKERLNIAIDEQRYHEVAADGRNRWDYEPVEFGPEIYGVDTRPQGPQLTEHELRQLDQLIAKLPEDNNQLPPKGRRLVFQVPDGDKWRVRVYDRANAPREVWDILRHIKSEIGCASLRFFEKENGISLNGLSFLSLSATGTWIFYERSTHSLKFWDPVTHKQISEFALPPDFKSGKLEFNRAGSLAVVQHSFREKFVFDTVNWKLIHEFKNPLPQQSSLQFRYPNFTADGRYLTFESGEHDSRDAPTINQRIFDTKTWERVDDAKLGPPNVLDYVESNNGKQAVVFTKEKSLLLWDTNHQKELAKLDENVHFHQVSFSPDDSMVAIATKHQNPARSWSLIRVRIWNTSEGKLLQELCASEIQRHYKELRGLQWSPDSQFIFAATDQFQVSQGRAPIWNGMGCIHFWDTKSSRYFGLFADFHQKIDELIMFDNGRNLAAITSKDDRGSYIRFWNLESALKKLRELENPAPTASSPK